MVNNKAGCFWGGGYPIDKPYKRPFGKGTTPVRGQQLTRVTNHLLGASICSDKLNCKMTRLGMLMDKLMGKQHISRWWFQSFDFHPIPREMTQFDAHHIFQMGGPTTN